MAFTDEQQQALKSKLRYRYVKTRPSKGASISYVEGWHVIAEANRIFGYDCWDRQTLSPRCLWRETQRGETTCFYMAKVRITVRAGDGTIVREGMGTGTGRSSAAETAHEIALKAAETDATKRALATFGNPFGLALYDREQRGVTRAHRREPERDGVTAVQQTSTFDLHHVDGRIERFTSAEAFVAATLETVRAQATISRVYGFWDANLGELAMLLRAGEERMVQRIGSALKERIRALAQGERGREAREQSPDVLTNRLAPKEARRAISETEASSQVTEPDVPAHPSAQCARQSVRGACSLAARGSIQEPAQTTDATGNQNDAGAACNCDGAQRNAERSAETPVEAAQVTANAGEHRQDDPENASSAGSSAPGQLAFPKEKRIRDKAHLAFVANEPCLLCGRRPAQAHHLRFAQPRALGLKVSDEFTVPLCNGHHDSLHKTGDERAWWARHGILDPLQIANRLWAASRQAGNDASRDGGRGDEPPW